MTDTQLLTRTLTPEQRRRAIQARQRKSTKNHQRIRRSVAIGRGPRSEFVQ